MARHFSKHLYLTYEELKHLYSFRGFSNDWDLYLTYEELKRTIKELATPVKIAIYILPMRNWNSSLRTEGSLMTSIYILPMRNWNSDEVLQRLTAYMIYILPMRNWNMTRSSVDQLLAVFISYLWGIETLFLQPSSQCFSNIYILPMRNWNIFLSALPTISPIFISYLWGIETIMKRRRQKKRLNLYLTYEELKHWL